MEKTIQEKIQEILVELDKGTNSMQRQRHLEEELLRYTKYMKHHSNVKHPPTALELYCDENPDALECRIYDN